LRSTILVQLLTMVPVMLMTGVDDLFWTAGGCIAVFWMAAAALMWKRPAEPSRGVMVFLRFGYVILLTLAALFWLSLLKPWLDKIPDATVTIESPTGTALAQPATGSQQKGSPEQPVMVRILIDRDACDGFFASLQQQVTTLKPENDTSLLAQAGYTRLDDRTAPLRLTIAYEAPTRKLVVRLANDGKLPLQLINNRKALDGDRESFALEAIMRQNDQDSSSAGAGIRESKVDRLPIDFGTNPMIPPGASLIVRQQLPPGVKTPGAIAINSLMVILPEQKQTFSIPPTYWP
jgi:hypothetical protein